MFLPAYINPLVDDVVVGSDDKNNWQTSLWTASGIYAHSRPVFDLQSTFTEEEQTDLAYYQELIDYARMRTRKCPFMETKTFCSNCRVHCYDRVHREQIRSVMRYSGKRMLFHHPLLAISHLLSTTREKNRLKKGGRK